MQLRLITKQSLKLNAYKKSLLKFNEKDFMKNVLSPSKKNSSLVSFKELLTQSCACHSRL